CFEALLQPGEGMSKNLEVTITPHLGADHHCEYLVMVCIDITARKRAEEDLRTLVDAIPNFVWMLSPDGAAEYGNRRWCDYTGRTREEFEGIGWLQFIHPDDQQHSREVWSTAVHTGEAYEVEHRIKSRTGDYRWFLTRGIPSRDAQS